MRRPATDPAAEGSSAVGLSTSATTAASAPTAAAADTQARDTQALDTPAPDEQAGGWRFVIRPLRIAGRAFPSPAVLAGWVLGFAAAVAVLYNLALRVTTDPGVSAIESDVATPVLQAQSIVQGHLLLGGWRMLYDSYWTVEVPFYTLGVLVTGVNPVLLYLVPAVLAALLLLTTGLMAKQGLRGGAAAAAVGTLIALIGLPSNVWATVFLHGAWHVGTMLWCLLAFAGLRSGRWRAGWWVAVVLLTAGLLGDLQTAVYGLGPVVGAGVLAGIRTRRWRAGAPAVSAAAASVLAAYLIRTAVAALGGFSIGTINASATPDQRPLNLGNIPGWLPQVFGAGTGQWGNTGVPAVLAMFRYVALAAVLAAILAALWSVVTGVALGRPGRTGPDHWRIDDMLLLACLGDLAFYVYAAQSNLSGYLRYLSPFVVFGSLLAARMAGRAFAALRAGALRQVLTGTAAAITAVFVAAFVISSVQPVPPQPAMELSQFLQANDLHNGLGTYWPSALTSVLSDGQVNVRPVVNDGSGTLVRYGRQSTSDWYAGQQFQFLVFDTTNPWGGVDAQSAVATFGPIANSYLVGQYEVLVWDHPVTVAPEPFAG